MQLIKEASYNGLNLLLKRIKTTKESMVLLEHKQHSSEVYELLMEYKKSLEKEVVVLLEESCDN